MTLLSQKARKLLLEAARLLDNGWVRGMYAANRNGRSVAPESAEACQFCSYGALARARYELEVNQDDYNQAVRALKAIVPHQNIVFFNDRSASDAEEVTAKFREAANG